MPISMKHCDSILLVVTPIKNEGKIDGELSTQNGYEEFQYRVTQIKVHVKKFDLLFAKNVKNAPFRNTKKD